MNYKTDDFDEIIKQLTEDDIKNEWNTTQHRMVQAHYQGQPEVTILVCYRKEYVRIYVVGPGEVRTVTINEGDAGERMKEATLLISNHFPGVEVKLA